MIVGTVQLNLRAFEVSGLASWMALQHACPPIGAEVVQVHSFVVAALDGDAGYRE